MITIRAYPDYEKFGLLLPEDCSAFALCQQSLLDLLGVTYPNGLNFEQHQALYPLMQKLCFSGLETLEISESELKFAQALLKAAVVPVASCSAINALYEMFLLKD